MTQVIDMNLPIVIVVLLVLILLALWNIGSRLAAIAGHTEDMASLVDGLHQESLTAKSARHSIDRNLDEIVSRLDTDTPAGMPVAPLDIASIPIPRTLRED